MSEHIRRSWAASRCFRVLLTIAVVYVALRLAAHAVYLITLLAPETLPGWVGATEPMVPVDLQAYLDAAANFAQRQPLYHAGAIDQLEGLYQYSPAFALAFIPFLRLSPVGVAIIHTTLHILAYAALFILWYGIFRRLELWRAADMMILTLPVWLIFSAFWSDLGYLNVYIIMALLATLLIDAVLQERLGLAVLWVTVIIAIKPMWAFAAAVPLFSGSRKFFWKLAILVILAQVIVVFSVMLSGGMVYTGQQYAQYLRFLAQLGREFPWRGPESGFLGYNHSIRQTVLFILGSTSTTWWLATAIKWIILAPLIVILARSLRHKGLVARIERLELVFLLYLGVFIWLDMVWEASLGIAVFVYLLSTEHSRVGRALIWGTFIPYTLIDFWQLASYLALGEAAMVPGPYFITDPSIYLPIVMLVILLFYVILVGRHMTDQQKARKKCDHLLDARQSQLT